MFSQVKFQEDLANKMLGLPSFVRLFANDARANCGLSRKGRRRTKSAAISLLIARGYSEDVARVVVNDACDFARVLYEANRR